MEISGLRTHVRVGGFEVFRLPRLRLETRRHGIIPRAEITLPDPRGELFQGLGKGDDVIVRLGLRAQEPVEWRGVVESVNRGLTKDQILVKAAHSEARKLASVKICQAWRNEDPAEIVRYCVRAAGLEPGRIDSPGPTLPAYMAATIPAWHVASILARAVQDATGTDMSRWALWMSAEGTVHWGDFDEPGQSDLYTLSTGAGIIANAPAQNATGQYCLTTWLLPRLAASMLVGVKDTVRGVEGYFRAQRIVHLVEPDRARTHIYYHPEGMEYGR